MTANPFLSTVYAVKQRELIYLIYFLLLTSQPPTVERAIAAHARAGSRWTLTAADIVVMWPGEVRQ